jgi:predicted dehydrogenase
MGAMDWIIFGTGEVSRKFAIDLVACGHRVAAVASRDPATARAFASSLGLKAAACDHDTALAGPGRAVYIATPPALHEAHALAAIAAGKAVLIEKPMASDAAAAGRIAAAARAAGVLPWRGCGRGFTPCWGRCVHG